MQKADQVDWAIERSLKICGRAWTIVRFSLLLFLVVYLVRVVIDIRASHSNSTSFSVIEFIDRISSDISALFTNFGIFRSIADAFGNLTSLGEQNRSLFLFLMSTLTTVAILFCLCG
jgi:hypothetical protein